jgi:ribosomal protein S6
MPLYEMVMMCKIGETQAVSNLVKSLVLSIYQEGGVVRRFVNLGDRVSQTNIKAKDGSYSSVVRYIALEFDANPDTRSVAEKVAKTNSETLNVFTHKLNEKEYYKQIFNKEEWKTMEIPGYNREDYQNDAIALEAKKAKDFGTEDEFRKLIDERIEKSKLI